MNSLFKHPLYRSLIALFCCALWGSAFPTLKLSYRELGLMSHDAGGLLLFAGSRFFTASLILFGFSGLVSRYAGKKSGNIKKIPPPKDLAGYLLIGIFMTAFQYLFFYTGLVRTPGTVASVVNSGGIFFTVLLARLFFSDDRIGWQKLVGILLGVGGIILVNGGLRGSGTGAGPGVILLMCASLSGGLGSILTKKRTQSRSPLQITAWQMLFGSLLLLLAGIIIQPLSVWQFSPLLAALFFYSALLSAAAFLLWSYLLKYNRAGVIGFFKFAIPLFGTLFSALFLAEDLPPALLGSLACVAGGILLVTLNSSPEKPKL